MTNKELSADLKKRAIALGLCRQWQRDWTTEDKSILCDMYIDGLDFCIINNYPTTEYMKENFDGIMQNHGIYVDEKVSINGAKLLVYVINGESTGDIVLDNFDICDVYIRHNSDINIIAKGQSSIYINVFDNAKVNVTQTGSLSRVNVYKHGDNVSIVADGKNIQVKDGKLE